MWAYNKHETQEDNYYYTTTTNVMAINLTRNQADVNSSSTQLNGRLTASIQPMKSENTTQVFTDLCPVLNITQYGSVKEIQD